MSAADKPSPCATGSPPRASQQPTVAARSGGPGSLVAWDTLGREGRNFTGTGPTAPDIAAFTGAPALAPIRAYAGLDVRRHDRGPRQARGRRPGAGRRLRPQVSAGRATTTGSGWVDPASIDTVEYMTGGDSAIVAIQYSYLPSWISYLVDQTRAREAGRALFDAVYERVVRAAARRPAAAAGLRREPRLLRRARPRSAASTTCATAPSGALFAGPPNFNPLFREFATTATRQPGGRAGLPGRPHRPLRDRPRAGRSSRRPPPGTAPRCSTCSTRPTRSSGGAPTCCSPSRTGSRSRAATTSLDDDAWIPFVTFWQVTADLPYAAGVPAGHGHDYTAEYVDAWADVLQPAGWTTAKADQLRTIIAARADRARRAGRPAGRARSAPSAAAPGPAGCRCVPAASRRRRRRPR